MIKKANYRDIIVKSKPFYWILSARAPNIYLNKIHHKNLLIRPSWVLCRHFLHRALVLSWCGEGKIDRRARSLQESKRKRVSLAVTQSTTLVYVRFRLPQALGLVTLGLAHSFTKNMRNWGPQQVNDDLEDNPQPCPSCLIFQEAKSSVVIKNAVSRARPPWFKPWCPHLLALWL